MVAFFCIWTHSIIRSLPQGHFEKIKKSWSSIMTLEELVLEIVNKNVIENQKTILKLIAKKGFDIDQSTLSRVLKKLDIQKKLGRYTSTMEKTPSFKVKHFILEVPPNLIIVKTTSGFANALTVNIDQKNIEGIEGTIAGDDTIFVAVSQKRPLSEIKKELETLVR